MTADYVVSVTIHSYSNPTGRCAACSEATPALPGCCDVPDPVPLDQSCPVADTCDTALFYCIRAVGSAGLCENSETISSGRILQNNREASFADNPLATMGSGPWQVSHCCAAI